MKHLPIWRCADLAIWVPAFRPHFRVPRSAFRASSFPLSGVPPRWRCTGQVAAGEWASRSALPRSKDSHRMLFVQTKDVAGIQRGRSFRIDDLFATNLDAALLDEPPGLAP